MTEPESLVLEVLRAMRADMAEMRNDMREMKHRQSEMARNIAAFRREQAGDAETIAYVEARIDRMQDEIARIKRRLDIVD